MQRTLITDDTTISQLQSTKLLGVSIDECLVWNDHINDVTTKVVKNTGVLARISYLIPRIIMLYFSKPVFHFWQYCVDIHTLHETEETFTATEDSHKISNIL